QAKVMESNRGKHNGNSQGKHSANGSKIDAKGKQSSNKFAVLKECNEEYTLQPTPFETSKWSHQLINYFKERWEAAYDKEGLDNEDEDEHVLEELSGKCFIENEVEGMEEAKGVELLWAGIPEWSMLMFCLIHGKLCFV
ncbi:hypothetical protein Tco_0188200, partial [Tanacetum coccineum]